MRPAPLKYLAPKRLDEALRDLHEHGDEAKVLAGGQSLIPLLNLRLVQPTVLIDVTRIAELRETSINSSLAQIGATVTHRELELSSRLRELIPMIPSAASSIGHVAIRCRGTLGGSLAHADPAAEWPVVMTTLEAVIVAASVRGVREIAAAEFFKGFLLTGLEADELITAVRLRVPAGSGWSFMELARQPGAFALAMVAATVDPTSRQFRLVIGACGDAPFVAKLDPTHIIGPDTERQTLAEIARQVANQISPPSDLHVTGEDRRALTEVLVMRALDEASRRSARTGGNGA